MPVNIGFEVSGPGPRHPILALILLAVFCFLLAAFLIGRQKVEHVPEPIDLAPVLTQLEKMRQEIVTLRAERCMTVNTPILQMSVYNTPNLGTKPVPTYDKSAKKGGSDVREVPEATR